MNLKPSPVIRATALIALLLPLAGCGNKGPLVLPPGPPSDEAQVISAPAPADTSAPADAVPDDGAPPVVPAGDSGSDVAPPPPAAGEPGNG